MGTSRTLAALVLNSQMTRPLQRETKCLCTVLMAGSWMSEDIKASRSPAADPSSYAPTLPP
jgi:hypothetical protein